MKEQIKIKIKNYINKNFYKGDIKDKINLFDTGIISYICYVRVSNVL